jgi:hypothetical protein
MSNKALLPKVKNSGFADGSMSRVYEPQPFPDALTSEERAT